ncbi:hypothetical protein [Streptomyces sp. NPDC051567]|uniref:hypothetical protein n=1 Tax=Streptomyces sp. NPDC051567 TaxID=3365660 RepID=UPI00378D0C7E
MSIAPGLVELGECGQDVVGRNLCLFLAVEAIAVCGRAHGVHHAERAAEASVSDVKWC